MRNIYETQVIPEWTEGVVNLVKNKFLDEANIVLFKLISKWGEDHLFGEIRVVTYEGTYSDLSTELKGLGSVVIDPAGFEDGKKNLH